MHTHPENQFQSLTIQSMSTPMEVGEMSGGMENTKRRQRGRDPSEFFHSIIPGPDAGMSEQGRGRSAPPPPPEGNTGVGAATTLHNSKKKHIRKPKDFTNTID